MAATSQKKKTAVKSGSRAKKSAPAHVAAPSAPRKPRPGLWGALLIFLGAFCVVGYFPVDAVLVAPVCGFFKGLLGYGYFLFPAALMAAGVLLLLRRGGSAAAQVVCILLLPVVLGALIHVLANPALEEERLFLSLYETGAALRSGGVIAGLLGWGMRRLLSVFLALPLLLVVLAALVMAALRVTPGMLAGALRERRERRALELAAEAEEAEEAEEAAAPLPASPPRRPARRAIDVPMDEHAAAEPGYQENKVGFFNASPRVKTPAQVLERQQSAAAATPSPAPEESTVPVPVPLSHTPSAASGPAPAPTVEVKPLSVEEAADIAGVTLQAAPADTVQVEEFSSEVVRSMRSNAKKGIDASELASATEAVARAVEEKDAALSREPAYSFPPVTLLRPGSGSTADGREEILLNSERLQSTLDSFGVNASIADVTRGPTVTRYDLELEAGVKLAKLTNLAGDLALSLGVTGVRIAPIPDKISTVGVEVPNKIVSTVYLRDIIDTDVFRAAASRLTFAIGKDIGGNPVVGNIAKLPHLLIAGTTGSGKSVCMNSLILSLLYKSTPEEVRLIMIDPKMVELGIYNGIPHLYVPVVTDPKKAAGSLQWSVVEMLKRYRLFSEAGVRDLAGYNAIRRKNGEPTLPQVVVVIDELADLMMVASKEVEESICRVAQMGRASGMHLVIATQRPSADVITGLMKANIPSRIAFAVSSAMESRIILDQMGAEKLVGSGDMLYAPIGIGKPSRIQGAFVSDEEREEIVNFIKAQGEAQYSEEILHSIEQAAAAKDGKDKGGVKAESVDEPAGESGKYDEMLPQAVDVIFETKQASVSLLQRRLKLGYSRAARIVDQMEELGVVGPFEGSKPRQILLTREQWLEMQTVQGTAPVEKIEALPDFATYQDENPEEWTDA